MIKAEQVKVLRDKTGIPMMECKRALVEANGDMEKSIEILRKRGFEKSKEINEKTAEETYVCSYVHGGSKIGVLLEMACMTDFVARNSDFKALAREIAMHIAASNPRYLSREEVPPHLIEKEREIAMEVARREGKPEAILERIVEGKIEKFYKETCLLEQPFIMDSRISIQEALANFVAKSKEKVVVSRFTRYGGER